MLPSGIGIPYKPGQHLLLCTTFTPLYDFSTVANKAFGNNQFEIEPGVWAFYTGDLNQDEYIDGNDFPRYDFESASGGLYDGSYTITDMNGDGFVDGNDFPVFDNNSFNGVSSMHPYKKFEVRAMRT